MLYEHAVGFDKSSLGNAFFKAKEGKEDDICL